MPLQHPAHAEFVRAYLTRDPAYDSAFVTAVRTTGIFCRPTCPARKPKPVNVEFFSSCREAMLAGYRPCKRCNPLALTGQPPDWLAPLLKEVDRDPRRRWRDADLMTLGINPARAARWFRMHHGMTFHAYSRARRLAEAIGHIQAGRGVSRAAFDIGYESISGFNAAFHKLAGGSPTSRKTMVVVELARLPSPLGPLLVGGLGTALVLLEFADRRMLPTQLDRLERLFDCVFVNRPPRVLDQLSVQLGEYLGGTRQHFDIPLDLPGTPFQRRVWAELQRIPHGSTATYAEIARAIGQPAAIRAVARANGDNRVAILVPCHRVVGSGGQLTGYGGGLWRKRLLLALEARHPAARAASLRNARGA